MFERVPDTESAVPLAAIDAIVLDTETTGLDTAGDRVIEIGALRLGGLRADAPNTFSELINPSIPVPEKSIAIHGIKDTDLARADPFPDVAGRYAAWAGPGLIIGYSIGFDLAILKSEHERHDMAWVHPRSLDVRHLVQILAPDLPDDSLETVAVWLGVDPANRHRALADAEMTAAIFTAIIPKLADRGIKTLGEAERAVERLASRRAEESRAGWLSEDDRPTASTDFDAEYARVDSFPYRHRVRDLMQTPPLFVETNCSLANALTQLIRQKTSSFFLKPGAGHSDYGILTERDILRAIDEAGVDALKQEAAQFASYPLVCVEQNEFIYRALSGMGARDFRHLGVTNADGEVIGALSARDLLRQRAEDAVVLGDAIERAESPADLGRVWSGLTMAVQALVLEEVDIRNIAAIISRELRAMTARACVFAEAEMAAAGEGSAPVPYAMLVLGSGGRGESLLAMDQDNAIIHAGEDGDSATDAWFKKLGARVADILNDAGVRYCDGGVMASNSQWRHNRQGWLQLVRRWVSRSRPDDIMNADIFFDAVCVHGDRSLLDLLMEDAVSIASKARPFLNLLAINASKYSVPVGMFGRLKSENGRIDLKKGGVMPIFSAARVVALRHAQRVRSTRSRLEFALTLPDTSTRSVSRLLEAHAIFLTLILKQQLSDMAKGIAPSNNVVVADLSPIDRDRLKWALSQMDGVADILAVPDFG